jgi:thioester reductase-like protein
MEDRIHVISGDIVQNSNLGTNKNDLRTIANQTEVVINSGALVKHFGNKQDFENINVIGTKNLITFCQKFGKRLLHISTLSVSGNDKKDIKENVNIFSERNLYIGQDFTNLYVTTKFEAELAVLEAIYDGLDGQILRLGNITSRFSDGKFQRNISDNAFAKRLKSFIEIGAFPKYILKHKLEFTPVDLTVSAIIKILNYSSDCNVFHIMNSYAIDVPDFINTITSMGLDIIPVSDVLMNDIINGMLVNDERKEAVSGIVQDLSKDKKLIYTSSVKLDCNFTQNYLKSTGFKWKKIDKNYIIRYLNYFKEIGFLNF